MLERSIKNIILLVVDAAVVGIAPFLALFIRFDGVIPLDFWNVFLGAVPYTTIATIGTFCKFGLYNRLWRYASVRELVAITGATSVSSLICLAILLLFGQPFPRSVVVISWFITIIFVGASRFLVRLRQLIIQQDKAGRSKVLIVGAGDAGALIAREIQQHYRDTRKIVGFLDDDKYKKDQMLFGVKILGGFEDITRIIEDYEVNEIIIAMPSADGEVIKKYVTACRARCKILIVPGVYELIDGKVSVSQLRDVEVEDLLRREPVQLKMDEIEQYIRGKVVLVTGAGGSIGSELCRQIARMSPGRLVLLGKGENSIFEIYNELKRRNNCFDIQPFIADVRDERRITAIFREIRPQVVFHAAAHKHVPLMEVQPDEAVANNVFGTKTVAEVADRFGVETFVLISTDKAVNPTSVMGTTKRIAEMIVQNMSKVSKTKFLAVRFGNVLGSRGSVVQIFKRQIARGGPVTVTHPEMKRYFMTIPEACQLVLQAGALARGGEVFVLNMGDPVKILDMANDLIRLSGLTPGKDIQIEFTGVRPGEKLFEELLTAEEGTAATKHEKIFVAKLDKVDELRFTRCLAQLKNTAAGDDEAIIDIFLEIVPTYQPSTTPTAIARTKVAN